MLIYIVYKSTLIMNKLGVHMGEIRGVVTNGAEAKFRQLAMKKFGYGKGSLSKALEEALDNWIKMYDHESP